jgi:hypothetical protein
MGSHRMAVAVYGEMVSVRTRQEGPALVPRACRLRRKNQRRCLCINLSYHGIEVDKVRELARMGDHGIALSGRVVLAERILDSHADLLYGQEKEGQEETRQRCGVLEVGHDCERRHDTKEAYSSLDHLRATDAYVVSILRCQSHRSTYLGVWKRHRHKHEAAGTLEVGQDGCHGDVHYACERRVEQASLRRLRHLATHPIAKHSRGAVTFRLSHAARVEPICMGCVTAR